MYWTISSVVKVDMRSLQKCFNKIEAVKAGVVFDGTLLKCLHEIY